MDQIFLRPDLLPSTVPVAALWAFAAVALLIWAAVHREVRRRFRDLRVRLGILVPVGTVASWAVLQLLGRYLFFAGRWHLLFAAFVAGFALELVSWLYQREASRIASRRVRRVVVACRMAAIALLVFVVMQPELVGEKERTVKRRVVVLLDDSASMHFRDKYWTDEERLDMAAALGVLEVSKEDSLETLPDDLAALHAEFSAARDAAAKGPAGVDGPALAALAKKARDLADGSAAAMDRLAPKLDAAAHGEVARALPARAEFVRKTLLPQLDAVLATLADGRAPDASTVRAIGPACDSLASLAAGAEAVRPAGALAIFDTMGADERARVLAASDTTRAELARRLLAGEGSAEGPPLEALAKTYDLDLYRFGSFPELDPSIGVQDPATSNAAARAAALAEDPYAEDPYAEAAEAARGLTAEETAAAAREEAFRSSTDLSKTFEKVVSEIPFEEIAGFVVVTDGRHNGDAGVDAVSRRLGAAKIPVNSVVIGGSRPPVDLAIAEARAPESVFEGEKVRVSGTVQALGSHGKSSTLHLYVNGETVDAKHEETIDVNGDDFVKEFRFVHVPETKGVYHYTLKLDPVEGEEFPENNEWTLDVAVSDDRTNVLLVDDFPRWEFRYLRNLFYGRDKSVHLQEYLVHPDKVTGFDDELPPASAARKFGDSKSGSFPVDRNEWRKFHVIILGDLGDDVLTPRVANEIKYCVEERGALLVLIDGPRAMPHGVSNPAMRELMPVETEAEASDWVETPDPAFHMRLAPAGRGHPVMAQSTSSFENEQIWNDFPEMRWRHPVLGVKPGAEVLAWAEPEGADEAGAAARRAARDLDADPEAAVAMLAKMREDQARSALVVARTAGRGKVLQLNTDRTWRLRYRVGDTHHHRFWGQVLRWGAGEKLRAGNDYVRLGTDALRYTPTEKVRVSARLQDQDFNALENLKPEIAVLDASEREVRRARLRPREDGNGFYEVELEPFQDPGAYTVWLNCDDAWRILGADWPQRLHTRFVVVTARRPSELVNVSASAEIPRRMARETGGAVVRPSALAKALEGFGEGRKVLHERTELLLWDHWLVLVALVSLLATEWILRKKAGLS